MDPYVLINYANESRDSAMPLIRTLEQAGIRVVHGVSSEEKIRESLFVVHLSTPASRSSKSYRKVMNHAFRYDKANLTLHMDGEKVLTDAETMLDTILAIFKYSCRNGSKDVKETEIAGIFPESPATAEQPETVAASQPETAAALQADNTDSEPPAPASPKILEILPETEPQSESTAEIELQPAPEAAAEPQSAPVPSPESRLEIPTAAEQRSFSERERLYAEGQRLLTGEGGEQDAEKAFELFKQSANQGYTRAQYQMCVCYDEGIGVHRNIAEAARWCEMAAYGGYDKAQSEIGYCYEYGHGVTRNTREAVRWYRIAAQQGNIEAKNNLAFCYQKGRGVTKNVDEAIRLYTEAASAGHASALYNLGFCYWYGEGVAIDKQRAVELFRESAAAGNARADQMMKILNQHSYIRTGDQES